MASVTERSYEQEKSDRGVVAELQIYAIENAWDMVGVNEVSHITLTGGTLNKVERETLNKVERKMNKDTVQIDAAVHPDGSVTIKTFRFATNIPLKELEILVNLAKAAKEEQDKPMEVPF